MQSSRSKPISLDSEQLSDIFLQLAHRSEVSEANLLQLEFAFLPVLTRSRYGTPLVQKAVLESPILFVQLLASIYRRRDEEEHPSEWQFDTPDKARLFARAADELFDEICIVSHAESGEIEGDQLARWVDETQILCQQHDLKEPGDQMLGKLLAREVSDAHNGLPEQVARVMEETGTERLLSGFENGVLNSRGIYTCGIDDGGDVERRLAERYREYAEPLLYQYPRVARAFCNVADTYDYEASRIDEEKVARRRLR